MQAIQVKFIGATNTKPSRFKAICEAGSFTASVNHSLSTDDNEMQVALALMEKLGWNHVKISGRGHCPNGNAVFTLARK